MIKIFSALKENIVFFFIINVLLQKLTTKKKIRFIYF